MPGTAHAPSTAPAQVSDTGSEEEGWAQGPTPELTLLPVKETHVQKFEDVKWKRK